MALQAIYPPMVHVQQYRVERARFAEMLIKLSDISCVFEKKLKKKQLADSYNSRKLSIHAF